MRSTTASGSPRPRSAVTSFGSVGLVGSSGAPPGAATLTTTRRVRPSQIQCASALAMPGKPKAKSR